MVEQPSSSNPHSNSHNEAAQNPQHNPERPFCETCGDTFGRDQDRERHEVQVHGGIRFECSVITCRRSWTRRNRAVLHMRQRHFIDDPQPNRVDTNEAAGAYQSSSDSSPEQDTQLYNSFVQGATTSTPPAWPPSQPGPFFDDSNFASQIPSQPFTYGSGSTAAYQSPYYQPAPDQPAFEYPSPEPEAESSIHGRATMSSQPRAYEQ